MCFCLFSPFQIVADFNCQCCHVLCVLCDNSMLQFLCFTMVTVLFYNLCVVDAISTVFSREGQMTINGSSVP